ncbi:MAG TPA: hypothetical protein VLA46_13160, partial [Saprospiraceae bacterium]|nr:hypothetical protein [Saprospiraceae bacterium]
MKALLLFLLSLICYQASGQSSSQKSPPANMVPNPGFEEYSDEPSGWYYSGKDFSRVAMFWTSPTAASPDIYG